MYQVAHRFSSSSIFKTRHLEFFTLLAFFEKKVVFLDGIVLWDITTRTTACRWLSTETRDILEAKIGSLRVVL